MKFLLDANLPRSATALLRTLGHKAEDVRDALTRGADDLTVAAHARLHHLALVTRDFDFSNDATASLVNQALQSFVTNTELLSRLPGRLAIVELWRVPFRPA